jgi:hypothetical protein
MELSQNVCKIIEAIKSYTSLSIQNTIKTQLIQLRHNKFLVDILQSAIYW